MSEETPPVATAKEPPAQVLYTAGAVTLATVLGGPLGGGALLAINEHRWGRPNAVRTTVVLSLLGTAGLMGLAFLLPDSAAKGLLPGSIFALRGIAQQLQGARLAAHVRAGGKTASLWSAAGVGIASLLVTLAVVFPIVFALPDGLGESVKVGTGEVRFTKGASEADARKVGRCLEQIGFFTGDSKQVQVVRQPSGAVAVRFFLHDGAWLDEKTVTAFQAFAENSLKKAFDGGPVDVELCNEVGALKRTVH